MGEAAEGALESRDALIAVHVYDRVFPAQAIAHLNALAAAAPDGAVSIRPGEDNRGLYKLLATITDHANQTIFRFALTGVDEPLEIATRTPASGDDGWSVDIGPGSRAARKLTLVIPLSDPAAYDGGDLQAFYEHEPLPVAMPLGRIAVFPSYVLRRIAPVTRGVRRDLFVRVGGPPYR